MALCVDTILTNPAGNATTLTCLAEVKISGVYHTFDFISNALGIGSYGRTQSMAPFLLHAGEGFSVNCDHSGGTAWASIIEFDASANINDARLFSLASGNNTLFTVPAGKTVQLIGFPSAPNLLQIRSLRYINPPLPSPPCTLHLFPT